MDISDLNEPSIFIAKDGTRWTESLSAYTAHPGFSPKIVNHIPKVTEKCDGCESLVGNVTLWYILHYDNCTTNSNLRQGWNV